ncbi:hypothetical protein [Sphingobacterium corticibacterium]|uniref:O-antigen ligase domain-containing protein n=1 Tax=Sphingobacterium corticibacterium TaxID=2484746 RepID=A0A4Q6XPQ2_9SPHI|nr:hypothetical protein [Sphingobacterium corticibacterium]RZF61685.1 hypothetical protein EWE74_02250 [Sphingobacterium corticibacterium]
MLRALRQFAVGAGVSFYLFPFGLFFFPASVNMKNLMALLGLCFVVFHSIQNKTFHISRSLFGAYAIALLFSVTCLFAIDYNGTNDFSYVTYITSFLIWTCGGYAVCTLIRYEHGTVNFKLITFYLAAVCLVQCVLALMIDRIPAFQLLVDTYISQGQDFLQDVNRLYGIGASLDPAGVRFSVVLILIATLLVTHPEVKSNKKHLALLTIAYLVIVMAGNMISRTTTTGFALSFFVLVYSTGIFQLVIRKEYFKFHLIFGSILIITVAVATFFYQTDPVFHKNLRFGFEGFFNWVETGVWRTGSTDKLDNEMWIWPTDFKSWIIGTGLFGGYVYGTDIGYCRFILYCGVVGLAVFSSLFAYCTYIFAGKYPQYRLLFFLLLVYTFVVWIKVSTDIYFIYAIFFAMEKELFTYKSVKGAEVTLVY